MHEFHRYQLETPLLETSYNVTHQSSLNTIRLFELPYRDLTLNSYKFTTTDLDHNKTLLFEGHVYDFFV